MATTVAGLDAHEQPSEKMRSEWKAFSRLDQLVLLEDPRIDDPRKPLDESGFRMAGTIIKAQIAEAYSYLGSEHISEAVNDAPILHHPLLPGLLVVPSLVTPAIQTTLIDRMLHRDLSNSIHQTNLHLHYDLPYPDGSTDHEKSFFSLLPDSLKPFIPKDPSVHKPLSTRQALQQRLHWVTLGGQYDWTNRVYPSEEPPEFPSDITGFLTALFPDTLAQAAIVNFYSPGDTMMMHRDVSEETDRGLVSMSFGCDALFMIAPSTSPGGPGGPSDPAPESDRDQGPASRKPYLLLRLRSGDAIYMTDESRYAWHGVPKVLKGTCPSYLEDWPANNSLFEHWRGWMKSKRINLNVRQMRE